MTLLKTHSVSEGLHRVHLLCPLVPLPISRLSTSSPHSLPRGHAALRGSLRAPCSRVWCWCPRSPFCPRHCHPWPQPPFSARSQEHRLPRTPSSALRPSGTGPGCPQGPPRVPRPYVPFYHWTGAWFLPCAFTPGDSWQRRVESVTLREACGHGMGGRPGHAQGLGWTWVPGIGAGGVGTAVKVVEARDP